MEQLSQLPYVRAILAESLRMYPQPPILIRRALNDDVLPTPLGGDPKGYPIGKGADIFISVWNLHRYSTQMRCPTWDLFMSHKHSCELCVDVYQIFLIDDNHADRLIYGRTQTPSGLSAFQRPTAMQLLRAGGQGTALRPRALPCTLTRWPQTLLLSPLVEGPGSVSGTSLHFWRQRLPSQCCSGKLFRTQLHLLFAHKQWGCTG